MTEDLSNLKQLVTRALTAKGTLGEFKAQIRATVFDIMQGEDRGEVFGENKALKAVRNDEEFTIICLLISQFFEKYNLKYSKSVFDQEVSLTELTNYSQFSRDQDALSERIGLGASGDDTLPLLWQLTRHSVRGSTESRPASAGYNATGYSSTAATSEHSQFVNRISSDQETPFTSPLKTQRQSLLGTLPSLASKPGEERTLTPPDIPNSDDFDIDEDTQNDIIQSSGAAVRGATIEEEEEDEDEFDDDLEEEEETDGFNEDLDESGNDLEQEHTGDASQEESPQKDDFAQHHNDDFSQNDDEDELANNLDMDEDEFANEEDNFDELHHSFEAGDDTLQSSSAAAGADDEDDDFAGADEPTQPHDTSSSQHSDTNSLDQQPQPSPLRQRNPLLDESSQRLDTTAPDTSSSPRPQEQSLDESLDQSIATTPRQDEFEDDFVNKLSSPPTQEAAPAAEDSFRDDDLHVDDDPMHAPINDDFGDLDNLDEDLNLDEDWMNEDDFGGSGLADDFGGGMSAGSGGGAYDFGDDFAEETQPRSDFATKDDVATGLETYDDEMALDDDDEF